MKVVKAADVDGWNMSISQLFGRSPKIHIKCGNCRAWFSRRFYLHEFPDPVAKCENCKAINQLTLKYG